MTNGASPSPVSYADRDGYIWIDGEIVRWRDARVHVLSHAIHYGSAVFEGLRAYNGKIFELHAHSERMLRSAQLMDLPLNDPDRATPTVSANALDDICQEVMKANNLSDAYIRPLSWRGPEEMGISALRAKVHTMVAVWHWGSYFSDGLRLARSKYSRPAPDSVPWQAKASGLYLASTLSKHAAAAAGYGDALMLDFQGNVAEATGANIFFLKDGELHTPIPDSFLNGITRQTVIQLAEQRGIKVVERKINPRELNEFEDCFVTGTAAEVTPVAAIQGDADSGSSDDIEFKRSQIVSNLRQDYVDLVHGAKL